MAGSGDLEEERWMKVAQEVLDFDSGSLQRTHPVEVHKVSGKGRISRLRVKRGQLVALNCTIGKIVQLMKRRSGEDTHILAQVL